MPPSRRRRRPRRVDAEPVRPEVALQQLGREQRAVRQRVRLGGQRGEAAHRERERLELLDQVQEPLGLDVPQRVVGDVGRPPGRRDERVGAADLQPGRLAAEHHLDPVEHSRQPAVRLELALPPAGERADRVDGHHPHPQPALGQAAGEVELGDVAAEEVREVDRRDQQVDARRRVVAHARGAAARPSRRSRAAPARRGRGARARVERGRRYRVEPQAALRGVARRQRQQPSPERARAPASTRPPSVSRPLPAQLPEPAHGQRRDRRERAVGAQEARRACAAGGGASARRRAARARCRTGTTGRRRRSSACATAGSARAGRAASPAAARSSRSIVASRARAWRRRAARSRRAAGPRSGSHPARRPRAPASGRGSGRTAPAGTAARRRAARAGTAMPRR